MANAGSKVGNETKGDMKTTGVAKNPPGMVKAPPGRDLGTKGSVVSQTSLMDAVKHLEKQHPEKYNDLGPHHGKKEHATHMPLGGMKPGDWK